MLDTAIKFLISDEFLKALGYLVIGAIIGSIISVWLSFRAQRQRLIVIGGGSSCNQKTASWSITLSNKPSFLGQALDGESAREVHGHIRLDEKKSQNYPIYWGDEGNNRGTVAPGSHQPIILFHWQEGTEGYSIVNGKSEPIARFQSRELKFILVLIDSLERKSEIPLIVEFDDTHLKNTPRLNIVPPKLFEFRMHQAKEGFRDVFNAFTSR